MHWRNGAPASLLCPSATCGAFLARPRRFLQPFFRKTPQHRAPAGCRSASPMSWSAPDCDRPDPSPTAPPKPSQASQPRRPRRARERAHLSELTWPSQAPGFLLLVAPGGEAFPGDRDHRASSGQTENGSQLRVTCWWGGRMAAPAGTAPPADCAQESQRATRERRRLAGSLAASACWENAARGLLGRQTTVKLN